MVRRTYLLLILPACLGGFAAAGVVATNGSAAEAERPNIVLINCDNLGYGDVGCFGSTKHRTPHVNRMTAEGMRLTSFYSASAVCTPIGRRVRYCRRWSN